MIKKANKKNNTDEVVAKCDQSEEVVAKCDQPEEVIANCDNKTPPFAKNSLYHSCSNS